MLVILDTNIFIGALLTRNSPPAMLYEAWKGGRFSLVTSNIQLREFNRVTRYPRIKDLIFPAEAGFMVNQIRELAIVLDRLPVIQVSTDSFDNFLFAMAQKSQADYIVTGDKAGVLKVKKFKSTKIVTARQMIKILKL